MRHTPLITEQRLHSVADFVESRGIIPELLFRLITASVNNPNELKIPFGGAVGQSGLDGIVFSPTSFKQFVPEGTSIWEIGTSNDPQKKATEDFTKRTRETSEETRKNSSFIFVTPRSAERCWSTKGKIVLARYKSIRRHNPCRMVISFS